MQFSHVKCSCPLDIYDAGITGKKKIDSAQRKILHKFSSQALNITTNFAAENIWNFALNSILPETLILMHHTQIQMKLWV